mgnify:FL=1
MKTYPSCEFFIYDTRIFYNNTPIRSGSFSAAILNVPAGHLSLYEYNIDRAADTNPLIYPFITWGSDRMDFNTVSHLSSSVTYTYGDTLTGSYPMSASIVRELLGTGSETAGTSYYPSGSFYNTPSHPASPWPRYPHYAALKNTLNYYSTMNRNFAVLGPSSSTGYAWDKDKQKINLISIPSIFYGSEIKPGSVSLKWYYTGSLIGELQDTQQNGALIQVGPAGSVNSGSVGGVVLYEQGFILLTGSWALNTEQLHLISGSALKVRPQWLYFGVGALDNVNAATTTDSGVGLASASFGLSFKGTTETQVVTMFAHARRGEVNFSSNPSFIKKGQSPLAQTSSYIYEENSSRVLFNSVSSSYEGYEAPFKRQVFVSKVAIYDDKNNLMGVASLANPVLKDEEEDFTFKLRVDV